MLTASPGRGLALAVIKSTKAVLDPNVPFSSQLAIMNFPKRQHDSESGLAASSPFYMLQSLIQHAIAPALTRASDSDADVTACHKKLAELQVCLSQLDENIAIPHVLLQLDPRIQQALDDCKAAHVVPSPEALQALQTDQIFLNKIQKDVGQWVMQIQQVTNLERPVVGSPTTEIEFWLRIERELLRIDQELDTDGIKLVLETLKYARRFHATVSFIADTGIKPSLAKVQKYNIFMRDFPINKLLSSQDLSSVNEAVIGIFGHMNKKIRVAGYPIARALPFVGGISADLHIQMSKILSKSHLLRVDFERLKIIVNEAKQIFAQWDELLKEFINVAREVTRKRGDRFIPVKVQSNHALLADRIQFVFNFRMNHEHLVSTIQNVMRRDGTKDVVSPDLGFNDPSALLLVQQAITVINTVDPLDISTEGSEAWAQAELEYNDKISHVENQIITRLKDRLATCRNAADMFGVFSKFNAMFVRPKIRGAVHEYQTQLIERVKTDIAALHAKFMMHYSNSDAVLMSRVRDIPPVAGAIIWAKQIERQLDQYMSRIEDVLGKGWEQYASGRVVYQEEVAFKKQLDTTLIFDDWVQQVNMRNISIKGPIFDLVKSKLSATRLELRVNFDQTCISLFKETRNLARLDFTIPHNIITAAKDAKRIYPYAVSLSESLRTYESTNKKVKELKGSEILVANAKLDIQRMITKGMTLNWEQFLHGYELSSANSSENRHVAFVRELSDHVNRFNDQVGTCACRINQIEILTSSLSTVAYSRAAFDEILNAIQKIVA